MAPGSPPGHGTRGDPRGERALAGLGTFAGKVGLATVLAIGVAAGALRLYEAGGGVREVVRQATRDAPPPDARPLTVVMPPPNARPPTVAMPPLAGAGSGEAAAITSSSPAPPRGPAADAAAEIAMEVERRRVTGALREAVKRFAPCAGGDVRRTASIDGDKVVKLAREKEDGLLIEEFFDRDGRLREARVHGRAGAGPSTRMLLFDEAGRTLFDEAGPEGAAGTGAPLDRRDPSGVFFGGAGCVR